MEANFAPDTLERPKGWSLATGWVLLAITLLIGMQAVQSLRHATASGSHLAQFQFDGAGALGINLDAVPPVPVREPMTVVLVNGWLEDTGVLDSVPDGQILISSAEEDRPKPAAPASQREVPPLPDDPEDLPAYLAAREAEQSTPWASPPSEAGVAISSSFRNARDESVRSSEVKTAFWDAVHAGQVQDALAQAARRADDVLGEPDRRRAAYWVAALGASLCMSLAAFGIELGFRRRWAAMEHRFMAARAVHQRVEADLKALEATWHAVPEQQRPAGFTEAWQQLQELAAEAGHREQPLVQTLNTRWGIGTVEGNWRMAVYEADAWNLDLLSEVLLDAGAVNARLDGTRAALDALSQPVQVAATGLLVRLATAAVPVADPGLAVQLREALGQLLDAPNAAAWQQAEAELRAVAEQLEEQARRSWKQQIPPLAPVPAQHLELRKSLGLHQDQEHMALYRLRVTAAVLRELLGGELESEAYAQAAGEQAEWRARQVQAWAQLDDSEGYLPGSVALPMVFGFVCAILGIIAGGFLTWSWTRGEHQIRVDFDNYGGMVLWLGASLGVVAWQLWALVAGTSRSKLRFTHSAKSLAASRCTLEKLSLRLDESRLEAVAAGASLRLYERELASAWRTLQQLEDEPLGGRKTRQFAEVAQQLARQAAELAEQDLVAVR